VKISDVNPEAFVYSFRRIAIPCGLAISMLAAFVLIFDGNLRAQQPWGKQDIDSSRQMLRDACDAVKKNYYDTKFHGLDWDARCHQYEEEMKTATSLGDSFSIIADFLAGLKDSHTFFEPPARPFKIDYGYRFQMIGDSAFVSRVRPGTDAESKLHPGDQIVAINKVRVTRNSVWQLNYMFNSISPQPRAQLLIRDSDGQTRTVEVASRARPHKKVVNLTGSDGGTDLWQLIRDEENEDHTVRQRWVEVDDALIWKMPEFFLEDAEIDRILGIARKHKTLILDLRGNPGGELDTLTRMLEDVFDHDVKIGDRVGRKESKPIIAKSTGRAAFTGKIIVLIDSDSASASELFARVIQLEHRGTVIGDLSSGSVMAARGYGSAQGLDTKIFYGFSVTVADLLMGDGKSLEHAGVTPDEILLPTGEDIAKGRDPVLAHAAELAGVKIEPATAGKLFPFEWAAF
jgi:C-terminal processing protease CtpA/Prc